MQEFEKKFVDFEGISELTKKMSFICSILTNFESQQFNILKSHNNLQKYNTSDFDKILEDINEEEESIEMTSPINNKSPISSQK